MCEMKASRNFASKQPVAIVFKFTDDLERNFSLSPLVSAAGDDSV
jgi:hypothetical protein